MTSITVTLCGNQSVLEAEYFPPIELNPKYEYECGLVDFQAFHCIPNIDEINNQFCYGIQLSEDSLRDMEPEKLDGIFQMNGIFYQRECITIPTGSYEIDEISEYIRLKLGSSAQFDLHVNKNTLKCQLLCNHPIDFTLQNSVGSLLGFSEQRLVKDVTHTSDRPVDIIRVSTIRVECNITKGAYFNNNAVHTLYEFYPLVDAGYKIVQSPPNVIYLPITIKTIRGISLSFIDQNNRLINFRNESVVVRLHIRKVNS